MAAPRDTCWLEGLKTVYVSTTELAGNAGLGPTAADRRVGAVGTGVTVSVPGRGVFVAVSTGVLVAVFTGVEVLVTVLVAVFTGVEVFVRVAVASSQLELRPVTCTW
jgi:hypothetical protein